MENVKLYEKKYVRDISRMIPKSFEIREREGCAVPIEFRFGFVPKPIGL